jgi:hypothetical protein
MARTEGEAIPCPAHSVLRLSFPIRRRALVAALTWTNAVQSMRLCGCSLVFRGANCIACELHLMRLSTKCFIYNTERNLLGCDAHVCRISSLHSVTVAGRDPRQAAAQTSGGRGGASATAPVPGPRLAGAAVMPRACRVPRRCATLWKRCDETAAGPSAPEAVSERGGGRLAQRESASFTPRRSLVRSQYRPQM